MLALRSSSLKAPYGRPIFARCCTDAWGARGPQRLLESAPFLQPRFRLVDYPIGGLRLALKLTDLFNRPIRPVDLDNPTLTVTKYRAEHWLCGRHAVEDHTSGD